MKWEYKVVTLDKFLNSEDDLTIQETLNKYGADGWELVGGLDKPFAGLGNPRKLDSDSLVFKRTVAE